MGKGREPRWSVLGETEVSNHPRPEDDPILADLLSYETEDEEGKWIHLTPDGLRLLRAILPIYIDQSRAANYPWAVETAEEILGKVGRVD